LQQALPEISGMSRFAELKARVAAVLETLVATGGAGGGT
jgi:hypothetical protein